VLLATMSQYSNWQNTSDTVAVMQKSIKIKNILLQENCYTTTDQKVSSKG